MSARRVVVVGGGGAGRLAAASALATDERARVVVVDRAQPSGRVARGVEFLAEVSVTALDAVARRIQTNRGALDFDTLVLAVGGERDFAALPGLEGVANLDSEAARRAARRGRPVVFLGGGGRAVAEARALSKRGGKVTIVAPAGRVLPGFSLLAEDTVRARLSAAGVTLRFDVTIVGLPRAGANVHGVALSDESELPAAAVRVFGDERGATALARRAGARTTLEGLLLVDERAETSLPGVFACGRAVAVPHALSHAPVAARERPLRRRTACVAGTNAAGGAARLRPTLGTEVVQLGKLVVARTGHPPPAGDGVAWGDRFELRGESWAISGCIDEGDRRLWGVELIGPREARDVIDVFATGMQHGATLASFAGQDAASAGGRLASRIAARAEARLRVSRH